MPEKIGFIGAGNMGGALIRAVCTGGAPENVFIYDIDAAKAAALASELGCVAAEDVKTVLLEADFIVFAVKPQVIGDVLREAAPEIKRLIDAGNAKTAVSIAAGVKIETIEAAFAECGLHLPVVRLMPNLAALVNRSMILFARGEGILDETADALERLLAPAGIIERVTEAQLDLGCAISGCGPAFAYMFIEALADGGVQIGLPRDMSMRLAAQTLAGAAEMILHGIGHPGELKDNVCSPGGTTIQGVHALERGAFRGVVASAVLAANNRNTELGKGAK